MPDHQSTLETYKEMLEKLTRFNLINLRIKQLEFRIRQIVLGIIINFNRIPCRRAQILHDQAY